MINGSGNGSDDGGYKGEDTPNERPQATLAEHRPYVMALLSAATGLHGAATELARIAHELRVARDPIGRSAKDAIAEEGRVIAAIGENLSTNFGG